MVLVLVAGCGGTESGSAERGTERAHCKSDRSCAAGLVCLSDRCVRPAGADCQLVAESLATLELGNYAPREERAARELALRRQCEREHLSKEDGACLVTATSKDEIAWCPKPLIVPTRIGEVGGGSARSGGSASSGPLVGMCETYVRTLERFARCSKLPPESARALRMSIAQLRAMYSQYAATAPDSMVQSCQMANDATTKAMLQVGC